MNGSMVASILYVTGFFTLFAAIFLLPKSEKKLNGVMWLILALLAEMCWGGLVAGVINIVHIPVNIYSIGLVYLVSAAVLAVKIHQERRIQKYEWSLLDILFSVTIFLVVAIIISRCCLSCAISKASSHVLRAIPVGDDPGSFYASCSNL